MNAPSEIGNFASAHPTPERPELIDRFGRRIDYLRLSVTDRCDFRCTYCMGEKMSFLRHDEVMSLEECEQLVRAFVALGVRKLRITGGEPLVRKNVAWLLERLAQLPGLAHLVLTTNGSQLPRYAPALRAAGVERLNISLDTLDRERFRAITRVGELDQVLAGIRAARQAGFSRLKINTVMMRGVNDDEFVDLARFAVDRGLDLAFIEEMPLGAVGGRNERFISSGETLAQLSRHFDLRASEDSTGGPARYWTVAGTASRIGFISPHSHDFCGSCNRIRVSARGDLYPCLGYDESIALLPVLRQNPGDSQALRERILEGLGRKPAGHDFNRSQAGSKPVRFMSVTGG